MNILAFIEKLKQNQLVLKTREDSRIRIVMFSKTDMNL